MYYLCSKSKGADQLRGYRTQLICAFVFVYANCRFSHDTPQIMAIETRSGATKADLPPVLFAS